MVTVSSFWNVQIRRVIIPIFLESRMGSHKGIVRESQRPCSLRGYESEIKSICSSGDEDRKQLCTEGGACENILRQGSLSWGTVRTEAVYEPLEIRGYRTFRKTESIAFFHEQFSFSYKEAIHFFFSYMSCTLKYLYIPWKYHLMPTLNFKYCLLLLFLISNSNLWVPL